MPPLRSPPHNTHGRQGTFQAYNPRLSISPRHSYRCEKRWSLQLMTYKVRHLVANRSFHMTFIFFDHLSFLLPKNVKNDRVYFWNDANKKLISSRSSLEKTTEKKLKRNSFQWLYCDCFSDSWRRECLTLRKQNGALANWTEGWEFERRGWDEKMTESNLGLRLLNGGLINVHRQGH